MLACLLPLILSSTARAELELGEISVIDQPFRLDTDELALEISQGVLVTVTDAARPVGVVCVCSASAVLTPGTERERIALAARTAPPRPEDGPAPDLDVEGLVLLGVDVADELAPLGTPVTVSGQLFVRAGDGDVAEEVMVVDARANRVRAQARRMLRQVVDGLVETGMDPAELLALDRAERSESDWTPHRITAVVAPGWRIDGRPHKGLVGLRDPSGVLGWQAARVVVPGFSWTGEPLSRAGDLERRVDLLGAGLISRFEVLPRGLSTTLVSAAQLRVRAEGGPTSTVVLEFPHVEGGFWHTSGPEPEAWGMVSMSADGVPLDWHVVQEGHRQFHDGAWRRVHVTLPEPLPEGETLEISARWTDRQRYAHLLEVGGSAGQSEFKLYGLASNVTELLPRAPSHGGAPVAVRYEVGVIGGISQDQVLMSARPARTWVDEGSETRWTEGRATGGLAAALGRWTTSNLPTQPRVRLTTQRVGPPVLEADSLEVALEYLSQVLPDLPHRDVAAAQLWHDPLGHEVQASHGLVGFTLLRPASGFAGEPPTWLLASGLARLWWHGSAPTDDERTLAEAAGVAHGVWLAQLQGRKPGRYAEELFFDSLSDLRPHTSPRAAAVGGFLLARTLSARFGAEVVQEALFDTLAADGPADWSALERQLGVETGEDLQGMSTAWVEGGLLPSVLVRWSTSDGAVVLDVTSNLRHGRLDVPVQVVRRGRKVTEYVVVRDGRGSLEVPWAGRPAESIIIDPEGELLLGRTRVQRDDG